MRPSFRIFLPLLVVIVVFQNASASVAAEPTLADVTVPVPVAPARTATEPAPRAPTFAATDPNEWRMAAKNYASTRFSCELSGGCPFDPMARD